MEAVSYCVVYTTKPGERDAFVKEIFDGGLLQAIRDMAGCETYDYYVSEESDNRLMLMESWASDAHRAAHLEAPYMESLAALIEKYVIDIEHID